MPAISRILVPVDFSERSLGMMPYVQAIAERYGAEVVLLHVLNQFYTIPPTGISEPILMPVPQRSLEEKTKQLEEFGAAVLRGLRVRRLAYEGDPEAQIVAFARTENIQLIVMPTRGYGLFRRFLIGSVTSKVLHDVECPVLTGAHINEQPVLTDLKLSNIVCAIDLTPQSYRVLRYASEFARDFEARLSIVHVIPPVHPGLTVPFSSDVARECQKMARADIEKLRAELDIRDAMIAIQEGDVARQVCSFAESVGASLLIAGRGSHESEMGRLRANVYAIIRQAPCPVLSV
jgi:nucleotide-binding universal stress UspA family protein